jgi:peroxin-6
MQWSELLEKLPKNFTGADFYGLTSKAVMAAAERAIVEYEKGAQHDKIKITQEDFLAAAEKVKPSVTEADLRRYDELKKIYS